MGKKRVAVYCRVATKVQSAEKVEEQKAKIKEFFNNQEQYEITETYVDVGKSGRNKRRAGYKHMMTAVKKGKVDIVAVGSISVLSRSAKLFRKTLEQLHKKGVGIITVAEGMNTQEINAYNEIVAMATKLKKRKVN